MRRFPPDVYRFVSVGTLCGGPITAGARFAVDRLFHLERSRPATAARPDASENVPADSVAGHRIQFTM